MILKKTSIALTAALTLSLFSATGVNATTVLEVSPADLSLKSNAKETVEERITLRNTGKDTVDYKIYTTPYFVPDGEDKTPNFASRVGHNSDAIDWTSFEKDTGSLPAGESAEISFAIKIPECAASSHQWFAIFAEETSANNAILVEPTTEEKTETTEEEKTEETENKEAKTQSETHSDNRIASIINLEISENHPEKCGGTAEDPNPPYVKSNTDGEGQNNVKLPLLIGIIAASTVAVGGIAFLVFKKFGKKKPSTPKPATPKDQSKPLE